MALTRCPRRLLLAVGWGAKVAVEHGHLQGASRGGQHVRGGEGKVGVAATLLALWIKCLRGVDAAEKTEPSSDGLESGAGVPAAFKPKAASPFEVPPGVGRA